MISEAKLSTTLIKWFKDPTQLGCGTTVTMKLSDRGNLGQPDIVHHGGGQSFYLESKFTKPKDRIQDKAKLQQTMICHDMYEATYGRTLIVYFAQRGPKDFETSVWVPQVFAGFVWPLLVPTRPRLGRPANGDENQTINQFYLVHNYGAVTWKGLAYERVRQVVLDRQTYDGWGV